MRSLTNIASYVSQNRGTEPILILCIVWSSGAVYYADKELGTGSGNSAANAIGCIVEVGNISSNLDSINQAHRENVSITLVDDESNSRFLSKFTSEKMYKVVCNLYQAFDTTGSGTASLTVEILSGEMTSPLEWDEKTKTFSFVIDTKLDESEIGFSTVKEDLVYGDDSINDKIWPLCFGNVLRVPTLKLSGILKGTLQEPIQIKEINDSDTDFSSSDAVTVKVTNGKNFPQNTDLDLIIGNLEFTGSFNGDNLSLKTPIRPKYINIPLEDRDANDTGLTDGNVVWITEAAYNSGVRLVGQWCFVDIGYSYGYLNYCVGQNGTRCVFQYPWTVLLDSTYTISQTSAFGNEDWPPMRVGYSWPHLVSRWIKNLQDAEISTGSEVFIAEDFEDVVHIVNTVSSSSSEVKEVMAYRKIDGERVLAAVPFSYFTIDKAYDPSEKFVSPSSIIDLPTSCLAIILNYDLSFYEREGWETDVLYVSLESSVGGNASNVIEYILDNFSNCDANGTTFTSVETDLANFPLAFAVLERRNTIDLCREIAYQSGCALLINGSTVKIQGLFNEVTPTITLDDGELNMDSIKISQTDYLDIKTVSNIKFNLDWSGNIGNIKKESNTTNFGKISEDEAYFTFNNSVLVSEMSGYWADIKSQSWRLVSLETYLKRLDIEVFDTVSLDLGDDLLGYGEVRGLVRGVNYDSASKLISLELLLPIPAGEDAERLDLFYKSLTGDLTSFTDGLNLTDYTVEQLIDGWSNTSSRYSNSSTIWDDDSDSEDSDSEDSDSDSSSEVDLGLHIAYCMTAAPYGDHVQCRLDTLTGTQIPVYCILTGGATSLHQCIPELYAGTPLLVKYMYDPVGEGWKWMALFPFQNSCVSDCICVSEITTTTTTTTTTTPEP